MQIWACDITSTQSPRPRYLLAKPIDLVPLRTPLLMISLTSAIRQILTGYDIDMSRYWQPVLYSWFSSSGRWSSSTIIVFILRTLVVCLLLFWELRLFAPSHRYVDCSCFGIVYHHPIWPLSFRTTSLKLWQTVIWLCVCQWNNPEHPWNRNVVILMKFLSLAALKIVILTIFSAASDKYFIKMMTFLF